MWAVKKHRRKHENGVHTRVGEEAVCRVMDTLPK